ncbi:MAG TPA: hypothetical protein PKW68_05955, partial [bacterium]|nr:hypothetical protein [bacterium]
SRGYLQNLVTTDGFDQVQAYYAFTSLMIYMGTLGYDMAKIAPNVFPILINVNAVDDVNAWYNPSAVDLTFGTGRRSSVGEWHLASDHDIVGHEGGHLAFDRIIPALSQWYSGDGGAIHEGFADSIVALMRNDPELSEDFPPNIGRNYGPTLGLRTVAHSLKYADVSSEVHDRGQIYGGFWWSTKLAMEDLLRDTRAAMDLGAALLLEHGFHYATNKPGPADFVDAVLAGAKVLVEGNSKYGLDYAKLAEIIKTAAMNRDLFGKDKKPTGKRTKFGVEFARIIADHSDTFLFIPQPTAYGPHLSRTHMLQYAFAEGGKVARVLGSGLIVFKDANGDSRAYSSSDARLNIKINPTVKVEPRQALEKARETARAILDNHDRVLAQIEERPSLSEYDELEKGAQRDIQVIEREVFVDALRVAESITSASDITELVVLPKGVGPKQSAEDLYWRFAFGHVRFYVNADTGVVVTQQIKQF